MSTFYEIHNFVIRLIGARKASGKWGVSMKGISDPYKQASNIDLFVERGFEHIG